jgi:dTDP-3-amino-3,6-dideoxy-alpha-D-glucopyranose N,N-dimethyltransferase
MKVAEERLPRATFHAQSMSKLSISKKFDVIICLFSAIGYVRTEAALRETMRRFASHLKPGGVVIIEPWLTKETYRSGWPHMSTYDGKDIKIARMNVSETRGDYSVMHMHFTVAERNKKVAHFVDTHIMRLTPLDELLQMMRSAGLSARLVKSKMFGRGLLVGVKPSA